MAKLLQDILPQPAKDYNQGLFNQLIRKLQQALGLDVQTIEEADETEAINFFLNN